MRLLDFLAFSLFLSQIFACPKLHYERHGLNNTRFFVYDGARQLDVRRNQINGLLS